LLSEAKLQLPSLQINYQKAGPDGGPVILLLHGLGTRASFWLPVVPPLVDQGYQVFALDLPGFGHSDPLASLYAPACVGKIIKEFLDALDLGSVVVVGHSMGGTMAASLAIAGPARISALVLVDAFGFSDHFIPVSPAILYTLALPSLYYRLTRQPEKLIKPIIESNFHVPGRLSPKILEMAIAENWVGDPSERIKIVYGLGRSMGFRPQRREFSDALRQRYLQYAFPIFVIWGQEDRFIPVSGAYQIRSKIPDIGLHIVPDCGHVPPLEKTGEFNQVLLQFINTLDN
jgi:pimeloyl-ACP methyl ester carboxylesterase